MKFLLDERGALQRTKTAAINLKVIGLAPVNSESVPAHTHSIYIEPEYVEVIEISN